MDTGREEAGSYELHEGWVVFTGCMTGVKIVTSGTSPRMPTPTKTLARCLDVTTAGSESVDDDKSYSEYTDEEDDEVMLVEKQFRYNGMFYYCGKCDMSYET